MVQRFLMWFWVVWFIVFAAFLVWAVWVLAWDEPRKRRRLLRRLHTSTK